MSVARFVRLIALMVAATPLSIAGAQILPKTTTSGSLNPIQPLVVASCTNAAKTSVEGFYVLPNPTSNPVAGQYMELYINIRNICNGPLNIPWQINAFGNPIASGVLMNVPAGQLVEAKATWTGVAGTWNFFGYSDYANSLNDTGADRMTRYMKSVTNYLIRVKPDWATWGANAKTGAQAGINAAISASSVTGPKNIMGAVGVIYAGDVNGAAGAITGPLYTAMGTAPDGVKFAFSEAVKEAWTMFSSSLSVPPGLINFPMFAASASMVKAASALPPYVMAATVVSPGISAWNATTLGAAVRARVPAFEASQPGVDAAIADFATFMSNRFTAWRLGPGQLCTLMGQPVWGPLGPATYTAVNGTVTGKFCGTF